MANIRRNVSNAALRGPVYKTNVSTFRTIVSALYDKHKEQFYFNSSSPIASYGPYTTAYNTVVQSYGGTLTNAELLSLTAFEYNLGADMAEFDRLWIHGLSNQIAARTSFVNPTSTPITEVNSPTWTAYQGYQGNGSTSYLNTNYNPFVNGVKWTLNSASYGVYNRLDLGATATCDMGGYSPSNYNYLIVRYIGNNFYFNVNNQSINDSYTAYAGSTNGFFVGNRTSSNSTQGIKNGVVLSTSTTSAYSLLNANLYILAANNGVSPLLFSQQQISLSFIGSGAINQSNFNNATQTLGTSLGWAV